MLAPPAGDLLLWWDTQASARSFRSTETLVQVPQRQVHMHHWHAETVFWTLVACRQVATARRNEVPIVPRSVANGKMPVSMPKNVPQRRRKVTCSWIAATTYSTLLLCLASPGHPACQNLLDCEAHLLLCRGRRARRWRSARCTSARAPAWTAAAGLLMVKMSCSAASDAPGCPAEG